MEVRYQLRHSPEGNDEYYPHTPWPSQIGSDHRAVVAFPRYVEAAGWAPAFHDTKRQPVRW